jgi:hypothetical protein
MSFHVDPHDAQFTSPGDYQPPQWPAGPLDCHDVPYTNIGNGLYRDLDRDRDDND